MADDDQGLIVGRVVPGRAGLEKGTGDVFGVAIGDLNSDGFADIVGASAEPDDTGSLRDLLYLSVARP